MFASVPLFVRLPIVLVLLAASTLAHVVPLFTVALAKALVPATGFRRETTRWLIAIAENWIACNGAMFGLFTRTRWEVEIDGDLRYEGWYLVLCNHQSWVDIPVLQYVLNRRIPLLKFFLKQQLLWVPVLGLAWWALDFPFMRRYSKETLARHPELRGKDREATRRACERFRLTPVSVMNFVEGTRFTPGKQRAQQSPFAHLLKARAGGVAFVLDAMGDMLQSMVDVTIAYPQGRPTLMDLICGRIKVVRVHVHSVQLPAELLHGDYDADPAYRDRFQAWINAVWVAKDATIARLLGDTPHADGERMPARVPRPD